MLLVFSSLRTISYIDLSPHPQGQPTPPHGTQAAQGEECTAAESSQQGDCSEDSSTN